MTVPSPIPKETRRWMDRYGEYDIDNLKVTVFDDRHAVITCQQFVVNSPTDRWTVRVGWFESRGEVTLLSKILDKKEKVIKDLTYRNLKIRQQKEVERRANT